jgi:hypothetical protein
LKQLASSLTRLAILSQLRFWQNREGSVPHGFAFLGLSREILCEWLGTENGRPFLFVMSQNETVT